jgi:hypothetical protein
MKCVDAVLLVGFIWFWWTHSVRTDQPRQATYRCPCSECTQARAADA